MVHYFDICPPSVCKLYSHKLYDKIIVITLILLDSSISNIEMVYNLVNNSGFILALAFSVKSQQLVSHRHHHHCPRVAWEQMMISQCHRSIPIHVFWSPKLTRRDEKWNTIIGREKQIPIMIRLRPH